MYGNNFPQIRKTLFAEGKYRENRVLPCGLLILLAACISPLRAADGGAGASPAAVTGVASQVRTPPGLEDDGNDVAIWLHPTDPARSLVLASGGTAGLELFGLDGRRVGRYADAEIDYLDVSYGFGSAPGKAGDALIVGYDRKSGGLLVFTIDPSAVDTGTPAVTRVSPRTLPTEGEVVGLCAYRSPLTGNHYAFASIDGGNVQQWELYASSTGEASGAGVDGRLIRTIPLGFGTAYCAVDDVTATLYVAEETVGIWALPAEPETEAARRAIDLLEPNGHITEEVKGLALYRADDGRAWLIAGDIAVPRLNVYDLAGDGGYVGSFRVGDTGESEGLAVTTLAAGSAFPGGILAIFDEDNEGGGNVKLAAWEPIARALGLPVASTLDPRAVPAPTANVVEAGVETEPVESHGDAADDPAIWVHPTDPSLSLVIGTDKRRGLEVYDLSGKRIQSLPDGRLNNVDLRTGFVLGGKKVPIVAASNRTDKSIALYAIDPETRRLANVNAGPIPTGLRDPYGLCMYHSRRSGEFYVFINDGDDGAFRQWRLVAKGDRVDAVPVRDFAVGSQAEGCVADDETGALYVAEEDVGIWRYSAEPDGGDERFEIDRTKPAGRLTDDVEGMAIYAGPDGSGYLIASNQGADNYAVYRREPPHEFVGFFMVVANDALGIDGVAETDGLEVTSAPLGPDFPRGLFVAQDGRNITPVERQNFKLVSWEKIEAALGLPPLESR